jgi:hypothetical protein
MVKEEPMKAISKEAVKKALQASLKSSTYESVDDEHSAIIREYNGCEAMIVIDEHTHGHNICFIARTLIKTDKQLEEMVDYCACELAQQIEDNIASGEVEVHGVKMKDLLKRFGEEYESMYRGERRDRAVSYRTAVDEGDRLIREDKELVRAFVKHRRDIMSSDREVAAFYFAVNALKAA